MIVEALGLAAALGIGVATAAVVDQYSGDDDEGDGGVRQDEPVEVR